jgi:hypothetical protein
MTDPEKDKEVELHPSEWRTTRTRPREPFWGPRWWIVPSVLILIAVLTYFDAKGSPIALIIARSL